MELVYEVGIISTRDFFTFEHDTMIVLRFLYKADIKNMVEKFDYTVYQLMSDFGGIFGLYLGFSFFTGLDWAELLLKSTCFKK